MDLQKAIELVKQHPTMVIFQIINQRLESKRMSVKGEIDRIAETLEAILHNYDVNKENLKTSLEDAFLKLSSDEPYFNVVSTDSDKTIYKYNLLYILHNKNTGSLLVANPITLTVSLDINQDKIYHLTETDKVMFTVDFSGLLVGEILRTE